MHDVIIIGAGIAGLSAAAELADNLKVLVLEKESHPGYHASGRSAAMLAPGYGPSSIRALTQASTDFYHNPPANFCEHPLLSARDVVMLARKDQSASIDQFLLELENSDVSRIGKEELLRRHPLLKTDYAYEGVLDRRAFDIDVSALLQGYLNKLRTHDGELSTDTEVTALSIKNGIWQVTTSTGEYHSKLIVNASGAWANQVGMLAGAEDIGLAPKRRTAVLVDAPSRIKVDDLPMVIDIDEAFYMKPDAGRLLLSPANTDAMLPCDAQPEELDIAVCIDRIEKAFDLDIHRISHQWAGLRSFVKDGSPVIGFSSQVENFFWLAGQGGYGFQSAPAIARLTAALVTGSSIPKDITAAGVDQTALSPTRNTL